MHIKIFTSAWRCAYPHMRITRMNHLDPHPHGHPYSADMQKLQGQKSPLFYAQFLQGVAFRSISQSVLGPFFFSYRVSQKKYHWELLIAMLIYFLFKLDLNISRKISNPTQIGWYKLTWQ